MTPDSRTLLIAEAGVNHNGSLELALALVDAAAAADADAVKFQTFRADLLASPEAPKARYQEERTTRGESQLTMLRALELSDADHRAIRARCDERAIEFISSPFDLRSIDLLATLGIRRIKVPSGELTNVPYLRRIAALRIPVLLSTGMATLDEARAAVAVLEAAGCPRSRLTLLQCSTEYPTPPGDVNLRAMLTLRDQLAVAVGYSDHTEGISVPVAAVALGASVIEKHLTLDRTLPGPDHRASLEPEQFAAMARAIREVELALGDDVKRPTSAEAETAAAARKSIVAARAIAAGERLTEDALAVKRPGTGISPLHWDEVVGLIATRAYAPDEQIAEPLP